MWKCVAGSEVRLSQIKRCMLAQLVHLRAINVSLIALLASSRKLPKLLASLFANRASFPPWSCAHPVSLQRTPLSFDARQFRGNGQDLARMMHWMRIRVFWRSHVGLLIPECEIEWGETRD